MDKVAAAQAKAAVLTEALPYIQDFKGSTVLVKLGGSVMEVEENLDRLMDDVAFMNAVGIKVVIVHGGGKAISAELKRQNIPVEFINGLRNTCEKTIKVVDCVLHNQINRGLVEMAREAGGNAIGLSGKDILCAQKMLSTDPVSGEKIDIGFVGDITKVNAEPILAALDKGQIPVITPLGRGEDGCVFNINADIAACRIAEAIHARKLVFLSDVPGILRNPSDESSVIPTIVTTQIQQLIKDKVLSGGMLPKIMSSVRALEDGINKVHMIDGRVKHTLLLEIFTDHGVGTEIIRPDSII